MSDNRRQIAESLPPRVGGGRGGSQRPIPRPLAVTPAALRSLKDFVYRLYVEAGTPPALHIASRIEGDDSFPGSPSKATVHRIIGSPKLPAAQEDVVSVALLLAQMAGRDIRAVEARVKRLWVEAQMAQPLGTPVREQEPLRLEVHQAMVLPGQESLPVLPLYVERDHDVALGKVVERAVAGESVLVTLVGESSTGKTRACWEALRRLPDSWRVWHPYDPGRPEAALEGLHEVGPYTVIWLNEAQHYLLTPDAKIAEQITAKLRTVLADRLRGPVLVLATVWPRFWDPLTVVPSKGDEDRFEQQRKLLTDLGCYITVPKAFTETDLRRTREKAATDPRLGKALEGASDGEITQFLAGVPELMKRYRCASYEAKALIHAAMDYRRLGHGPTLSRTLLAGAVRGYLTEHELRCLTDGWFERALVRCGKPCNGVPGPLSGILRRTEGTPEPAYRLADYLEQQGRFERRLLCPPATFWESAVRSGLSSEESAELAAAAHARGRLNAAAALYQKAMAAGNARVRDPLAALLEAAGRLNEAKQLYEAELATRGTVNWELIRLRELTGETQGAESLAFSIKEDQQTAVLTQLARLRRELGDNEGAERLVRHSVAIGRIGTLSELARSREEAGDPQEAERAAFHALEMAGTTYALSEVMRIREQSGDREGAERLALEAASRGRARPAILLALRRQQAGLGAGAEALIGAAARSGSVFALNELARLHRKAGDDERAEQLFYAASLKGSTFALIERARLREKAGDQGEALRLLYSAVARGSGEALAHLALLRESAGASEESEQMACQAADMGSTFALLELLWQRERLNDRHGADRLVDTAMRGNPGALTLLATLREKDGDKEGAERLILRAARVGYRDALNDFVRRREEIGDSEGAERVARAGGAQNLVRLASQREASGSQADAERLYLCAVEAGSSDALLHLMRLTEESGLHEKAEEYAISAVHAGRVEALSLLAQAQAGKGMLQDADRLFVASADAGYPGALAHLAELRKGWDGDWENLLRYGLADHGATSPPW